MRTPLFRFDPVLATKSYTKPTVYTAPAVPFSQSNEFYRLAIPSGFSAEVMAQCGWDSVTVDMQHGVQDYQTMVQCFQAMDRLPVTKLVRVPWNEPGIVGKVLDGGAYGVICPMVNTRKEAQAFVSYCRYPPKRAAQQRPDPRRDVRCGRRLPENCERRDSRHSDD